MMQCTFTMHTTTKMQHPLPFLFRVHHTHTHHVMLQGVHNDCINRNNNEHTHCHQSTVCCHTTHTHTHRHGSVKASRVGHALLALKQAPIITIGQFSSTHHCTTNETTMAALYRTVCVTPSHKEHKAKQQQQQSPNAIRCCTHTKGVVKHSNEKWWVWMAKHDFWCVMCTMVFATSVCKAASHSSNEHTMNNGCFVVWCCCHFVTFTAKASCLFVCLFVDGM